MAPAFARLIFVAFAVALTGCGGTDGGATATDSAAVQAAKPATNIIFASTTSTTSATFASVPHESGAVAPSAMFRPTLMSQALAPASGPTPPTRSPIIVDTNPATTGIFVGSVGCTTPQTDYHCLRTFPLSFRHSLSYFVAFSDWTTSLESFIKQDYMVAWPAQNVSPLITWVPNGVKYTDLASGKWDAYLIASAQAVKAYNGTIFLRPFHEFNGKWFSYGLVNQGADAAADKHFIAAWRRMVWIFRQQGVTNVRWVWCFANNGSPNPVKNTWNDPANAYPGDQYVDWVAFDAFNRGNQALQLPWLTFDQLVGASYAKAVSISANRPVMIAELASNEWGDDGMLKSQWFSTLFSELPAAYPHLRAISYFNYSRSPYWYGLQSSVAGDGAWITGLRSVDTNGVLNFRGYNVPFNSLTSWQ